MHHCANEFCDTAKFVVCAKKWVLRHSSFPCMHCTERAKELGTLGPSFGPHVPLCGARIRVTRCPDFWQVRPKGPEQGASEGEKEKVHSDVAADPASKDHEELMIKVKDVSSSTSRDLLKNVLSASMCLERADKGCIKGSVRGVQKAKSLVGRWLERPSTNETSGKTDHDFVEIVIERDTVVRGGGPSSPYSPFFKLNLRPRSPGSRCTLVIENWEKENFSKILSRRSSKLTPKNHFFSLGAVFETPNQLFISRLP